MGTHDVSEEGDPDHLPLDVVFDLLSNRRRRLTLRYLMVESSRSSLSDLAEHIAAVEFEKDRARLTHAECKRVYIDLYHCHLPKLDGAGVVDVDDRGWVELAGGVVDLEPFLEMARDRHTP